MSVTPSFRFSLIHSPGIEFRSIGQPTCVVHCKHIAILGFDKTALGHTDYVHF